MGRAARAPLTVAHLDGGRSWRGGQQQVLLLARGLARRGIRLLLLAPPGPLLERANAAGIPLAPWRPRGDLDLVAAVRGAGALRRHRADLVHCHDARAHAVGWLAARLAGIGPLVVSRRTEFPAGTHLASRLKYALPVDRYLAVSEQVAGTLRRAGVPAERIRVVPSGIELPGPPDAPSLRAALGLPAGVPLAGVAGSLTAEKGQDVAIAALAAPGAPAALRLVLIGEGPRRGELEALAARLGVADRVRFTGFRADARALLRQLDLCLVPSRSEGLGTTVLEAQAEGVPVIASAAGGLPELVRDGETGRLVAPGDADALAAAIAAALAESGRTREWAERARGRAREYDIERTVRATVAVYEEVWKAPVLDAPGARG